LELVSPSQIELMKLALQKDDWQVATIEYAPESIEEDLAQMAPHLVFHVAYGYVDQARRITETQAQIAARFERLGINHVGSLAMAQTRAQDKLAAGEQLSSVGIAVPRLVPTQADEPRAVVLKPRRGGCHRGVHVVRLAAGASAQVPSDEEYLLQEYIDGAEFTVGVLEEAGRLVVLPPVEVRFDCPEHFPHVMVWEQYPWSYHFDSGRGLGLEKVAARAFQALELRDYARFDIRIDPIRGPVLLDANSLPNLDPQLSLLPAAAQHTGRNYATLITEMARAAHRRCKGQTEQVAQPIANAPVSDEGGPISS